MQMKGVYEISIFGDDNIALADGRLIDNRIRCAVAKR